MLRKRLTEFRVGLFVTAALILAMLTIFMIGGQQKLFERQYTLFANFDNISGLRIGAPVQLAGFKVGFVDGIRFPKELDKSDITVVLTIEKKFQERIREDSTATIETQGLLGDKFVYISVGSEAQAVIPDKGIIASKTTTSIFSLAEKAGDILDDIGNAAKAVDDLLGSVKGTKQEGDIRAGISSLRRTVEQVEKGKGFLHALIYDPKGEQAVSDFADTMSSVKDITVGAEKETKGDMGGLITNMKHASSDLRTILESVRRGEGTLGKFVNDPALYDDLRALFGRANRNKLLRAVIRSTISENDRQMLK